MEYLVVAMACGVAVLVFLYSRSQVAVDDAKKQALAHAAEAKVQTARADRYKRVLSAWGEDIDVLEEQAAAGRSPSQVKSHIRDLAARVRVHQGEGDPDGK